MIRELQESRRGVGHFRPKKKKRKNVGATGNVIKLEQRNSCEESISKDIFREIRDGQVGIPKDTKLQTKKLNII